MADSAETPYAFLDTEVFRAHQLDLQSPNIRRLVRLAVEGPVHLLLTTVTKGEVMDDLKERAREAIKQLKEVRRLSSTMRKIMPEDAVQAVEDVKRDEAIAALQKELDDFIAETGATVLDLDGVSADGIFNRYFEGMPPFGGQGDNKKVEFPDAFACGTLEAWSAANENAKIYVVSNDADWKSMCACNPALVSVARLDELLQHFTDTEVSFAIKKGMEEQRDELLKMIRTEAENLEVYVSGDMLIDGEIDSQEIIDVDIEEFNVVEVKDGEASVSMSCQVTVSAYVVANDLSSGIKDSEGKSVYYVFRKAGKVVRTVELTAEVAVTYDKTNPEQVTMERVEFEENSVALFIQEQELERGFHPDYARRKAMLQNLAVKWHWVEGLLHMKTAERQERIRRGELPPEAANSPLLDGEFLAIYRDVERFRDQVKYAETPDIRIEMIEEQCSRLGHVQWHLEGR
jgi:hypothetical protein